MQKKTKLAPHLIPYMKINSKWNKYTNIRAKAKRKKHLEECIGWIFMTLDLAKGSWIWNQKHKQKKMWRNSDFIKTKSFCGSKATLKKVNNT
jgi:hypothetical protein